MSLQNNSAYLHITSLVSVITKARSFKLTQGELLGLLNWHFADYVPQNHTHQQGSYNSNKF